MAHNARHAHEAVKRMAHRIQLVGATHRQAAKDMHPDQAQDQSRGGDHGSSGGPTDRRER